MIESPSCAELSLLDIFANKLKTNLLKNITDNVVLNFFLVLTFITRVSKDLNGILPYLFFYFPCALFV